jgi:hypothetical protein
MCDVSKKEPSAVSISHSNGHVKGFLKGDIPTGLDDIWESVYNATH